MELDETVAEVAIDLGTKKMVNMDFHRSSLKFKCQRCAVFCCKLGPPPLLPIDIKRLRQARINIGTFKSERTSLTVKEDGACSLLSFNIGEGVYECSIYDLRPTLCRLYPFRFERSGPNSYTVKFIPCCNGLNKHDGELVDERFFADYLQEILNEMIESKQV